MAVGVGFRRATSRTVRAAVGRGLLPSVVRCCERGSEPSVSTKCGEFLGQPRNCQLLRKLCSTQLGSPGFCAHARFYLRFGLISLVLM